MRKRLLKIGHSKGLIITKEILELLEIDDEVTMELAGKLLLIASPDIDPTELEASLAYVVSKRERAAVYQKLAT